MADSKDKELADLKDEIAQLKDVHTGEIDQMRQTIDFHITGVINMEFERNTYYVKTTELEAVVKQKDKAIEE